jgi:hypothetical protein
VPCFGRARLQEFETRRHVEEQVARLDDRADGGADAAQARLTAAVDLDPSAGLVGGIGAVDGLRARDQREPTDGSDRGQRLAAKAQGTNRSQVIARA